MSVLAIRAEGVGKQYAIGALKRHNTLRDRLAAGAEAVAAGMWPFGSRATRPSSRDTIWALQDVSFEISCGETLGIIGHNGAGKSTLLKILSRITEPTTGHIALRGRVGSLLEVGTGFHSELTGRENIYLNGAILGMTRTEIERKFDEIVAFAEVERFIDTPVKHYSSGMYLRLGFSVAAHLEPEILIVDEVLAVGDAGFQQKCLGRMSDVAREGRTVILVSHNMDAIQRLCSRCLLLERGKVKLSGPTGPVVSKYLSRDSGEAKPTSTIDLTRAVRRGGGEVKFVSAQYSSLEPAAANYPYPGGPLEFQVKVESDSDRKVDSLSVSIRTASGMKLINADVASLGRHIDLRSGYNAITFFLHGLHLNPGTYVVGFWAGDTLGNTFDHLLDAFSIEVIPIRQAGLGHTPVDNGITHCVFSVEVDSP